MTAFRVKDVDPQGCLTFDLIDFLELFGDRAIHATWTCNVGEVVPSSEAKYLPEAYAASQSIPGALLFQAAANTSQIIDGVFVATEPGKPEPWLVLRAVDSSFWEVQPTSPEIERLLKSRFKSVERDA